MNRDNTVLQWLLYRILPSGNLSICCGCCAGVVYIWFLSILPILVCGGDGLSAAVQWFPSVQCKKETAEEGFTEVTFSKVLVGMEVIAPQL